MSAPPPGSGGTADRVHCAYCGANNFPTAPACWQCKRPLKSLRAGHPVSPTIGATAGKTDWPTQASARRAAGADLRTAAKAAAALGLFFPWAGLPIGLAFLMLGGPERIKLGWVAIGWSIAGTVLSVLAMILLLLTFSPLLKTLMPHLSAPSGAGGLGGNAPSGLPPLGGEEFLLPHLVLKILSYSIGTLKF